MNTSGLTVPKFYAPIATRKVMPRLYVQPGVPFWRKRVRQNFMLNESKNKRRSKRRRYSSIVSSKTWKWNKLHIRFLTNKSRKWLKNIIIAGKQSNNIKCVKLKNWERSMSRKKSNDSKNIMSIFSMTIRNPF